VKQKRMTHYCIDKTCGWKETSHKIRDGISCPSCDGSVMSVGPKDKFAVFIDYGPDNCLGLFGNRDEAEKEYEKLSNDVEGIDVYLCRIIKKS
jgi:hypothetical protein